MNQNNNGRTLMGGLLGMFLLLGMATPLAFTACESQQPEIIITLESDYSDIVQTINNANSTLTGKLAQIESALNNGFAQSSEGMSLIQQAVASLNGTVAEKLAAIEAAIQAQTTSLETKLALIEAAVQADIADSQEAQDLIKEAIESLDGTVAEKLAAIEDAVKAQTTSFETKLGLIEEAVEAGFAEDNEEQALIKEAIESLSGTMAERLAAIEETVKGQTTSLETKLALIEEAIKDGAAEGVSGQELIQKAIESLSGSVTDKLSAIESAIDNSSSGLATKLAAIETAVKQGLADEKEALGLIKTAVESIPTAISDLDENLGGKIDDVVTSLGDIESALSNDIVSALTEIFNAIDGLTDYSDILEAIKQAIEAIGKEPPGSPKDLIVRCYPNASFDLDLSPKVLKISDIFCALDESQDGSYTAENIETVEFQPLNDDMAPVQVSFEKDNHFIRFSPDVTGSQVWDNFRDSTSVKKETVTGKLIVTDRWGTKDTISNFVTSQGEKMFSMCWFNTSSFSCHKKVSISQIDDDKVTIVLGEFSSVLGFDYDMLMGCRYTIQQEYTKLGDSKFISGLFRPEETALEVDFLEDYAVGDRFGLIERITVFIQPSEMDLLYRPMQMHLRFELTVEITGN